jgi:hypothetical protein
VNSSTIFSDTEGMHDIYFNVRGEERLSFRISIHGRAIGYIGIVLSKNPIISCSSLTICHLNFREAMTRKKVDALISQAKEKMAKGDKKGMEISLMLIFVSS